MPDESKPSAVEKIKLDSNYLRGHIAEELANSSDAFEEETAQLLKHHGMYQQDDRDRRGAKGPDGKKLGKAWSLMVRVKAPGGKMTCDQMLAQLDLGDELGNSTIRLTDRQCIQLHGVLKKNVRQAIRRINDIQMTTLGACGDVVRNVLSCPAPLRADAVRDELQDLARMMAMHLLPRSKAYHEVWVTDPDSGRRQLVGGAEEDEAEPLYGKTYLPRKFKVAFSLPDDNCVDVYANDIGFLAVTEGGRIEGFNVLVGGGMGVTPSDKKTFPAVARRLGFIRPDQLVPAAEAIIRVQRDFGNRSDRKRARMKYLIADWGLERFKAKVEEYFGRTIDEPHPADVHGFDDHIGWHDQGDGRWFYGLNVENGRVADREGLTLKSAFREVLRTYRPGLRITAHQSILFTDLDPNNRAGLEAILKRHGVKLDGEISNARRWSMACVALPTCPLAVTESERVMPGLIDRIEAELARLGLAGERFTIRMTGCPNGCARPYNADMGLVGRTLNKYTIYLGGRLLGDRLGFIYREIVPFDEIVAALVPVFACYQAERQPGETLGDFCHRLGPEALRARAGSAT